MSKEQLGGMGQEIPGDDLTGDIDPLESEHADTDLAELEKIIDQEARGLSSNSRDEDILSEHEPTVDERKQSFSSEEQDDKVPVEEQKVEEAEVEAAAEPDIQSQLEALKRENEIIRLEQEKREADLERTTLLRDREAGEKGSLLQKIKELERRMQAPPPSVPENGEYEDVAAPVRPTARALPPEVESELREMRSERQELLSERLASSLERVQQDFQQGALPFFEKVKEDHGFDVAKGLIETMNTSVAHEYEAVKEVLYGRNIKTSVKLANSILKSAFADAKMKYMQSLEELAQAKRTEAKAEKKEQRKAAGITSSEGGVVAESKDTFDPVNMPLEDLEKALDAAHGVDRGAGSEII